MRDSGSGEFVPYRRRWWMAVRAGTARRIRWPWGAATGLAVPLLTGVVSLAIAAARNEAMDLDAAVIGFLGALGGAAIWYLIVVLVSMRLAPSEIVAADAEIIRGLEKRVARTESLRPEDKIVLFDAHIDLGRPIGRRLVELRRAMRTEPSSDQEWADALFAARNWLKGGMALVGEHCISRRQDFLTVWRAVPSSLRDVDDVIQASGYARRRLAEPWVKDGSAVLRQCIALFESQIRG